MVTMLRFLQSLQTELKHLKCFSNYSGAFIPFTGYTNEIPKEQYEQNKAIKVDESNQETTTCQLSPIATTKEDAENDNATISNNIGRSCYQR